MENYKFMTKGPFQSMNKTKTMNHPPYGESHIIQGIRNGILNNTEFLLSHKMFPKLEQNDDG